MDPLIIGIIVIAALVIGIGLYLILRGESDESRAIKKNWGDVATKLRLKFSPPGDNLSQASLTGKYNHREVAIGVRVHAMIGTSGDRRFVTRTYARAFVDNKLRHFIRFSRKGDYHKTDRYLGTPLQSVGDAVLDRNFDIKGIPPNIATRVVASSQDFRQRLAAVKVDEYVELEVEGNEVRFEQGGLIVQSSEIMTLLELLDICAGAVEVTV